MKSRAFRNVAFGFLVTAILFTGTVAARASSGEFDFWYNTFGCSGGDFTSGGWSYVLCDTNCDEYEFPNWYQYFNNLTQAACDEYCSWQSTWEYYCYAYGHQTLPWGEDQCETFCTCFCEY
jgi:hypothetical protein